MSLRIPDDVRVEFEVEVDGDEIEVEIELKWSTRSAVEPPSTTQKPQVRTSARTARGAARVTRSGRFGTSRPQRDRRVSRSLHVAARYGRHPRSRTARRP
jgi:hypothetical protein